MATAVVFDEFKRYLGEGVVNFTTHTFKAALTNTAPNTGTNTVLADITQITAANGYLSGGTPLASVTWSETGAGSGVWRFNAADITFTASGGDIATHRYLVIYDDTPTSPADPLVAVVDRGSSAVITNGNTRTWDIGANGIFELS